MAKMTKSQFVSALAEKGNMSKKEFSSLWDQVVKLAYSEVKKNGEITLPGFGKLIKKKRKARMGRNPATGQQIQIPAKTVVKFRVAKACKDEVL